MFVALDGIQSGSTGLPDPQSPGCGRGCEGCVSRHVIRIWCPRTPPLHARPGPSMTVSNSEEVAGCWNTGVVLVDLLGGAIVGWLVELGGGAVVSAGATRRKLVALSRQPSGMFSRKSRMMLPGRASRRCCVSASLSHQPYPLWTVRICGCGCRCSVKPAVFTG